MKDRDVHTIQQTSKKWKALQLAGVLVIVIAGMLAAVFNESNWLPPGVAVGGLAVGLLLIGAGSFFAWWHHG